jgi:peptide/nickel transport system substrate-binding protein
MAGGRADARALGRTGGRAGSMACAAAVLLAASVACRESPGGDTAPAKRILRIAYEREIDLLNPFTSQNLVDISFSMIEGLITTDDSGRFVPVLAKVIPTTDNGLVTTAADGTVTMTWPLHSQVLWHDGHPFTSKDVCFTWRFVVDPASATYNREQYLGIKDCEPRDDTTVVFRWDGPYAYYQGLFEAILPEHLLGRMTAEEIVQHQPYNRGPGTIGTGPFKFAEWRTGEYIRVVRNDRYWRGPSYPEIDEVVWSFIPDANTRLNALKAGRAHFGRILPTQVKEVATLPGYQVHLVTSNSVMHFDLSVATERGRALFADSAVRRALFLAIDRQAIAERLMEGTVRVADGPISPSSAFSSSTIQHPGPDRARAAALLDSAGWRIGGDGIRRKGDLRLAFTILNRAGATDRIAVAQVIQAELKAIGVAVGFETLESAAWTNRWRARQWEAIVSAWFLPADPSLTGLYACDGANNMTGYCDRALDTLLQRSDRTLSPAARKHDLEAALARLAATARTLPLYFNVVPELVSTLINNYRGSGTNFGSFWNLYQWTLAR